MMRNTWDVELKGGLADALVVADRMVINASGGIIFFNDGDDEIVVSFRHEDWYQVTKR